jgi:Holliday junction resolvasome RuvABC endonuclease subunit
VAFLGIDQSLSATGVCRLDAAGTVVAMGTVDPRDAKDGERLILIKRAVAALASGVEFAALEGYSYDSVGRVFELGEIGGVVKVLLHESGIKYVVVPPVLLKKFATGSSSASKEAMVSACKERGARPADDNQADAFFLAHVARAYAKGGVTRRCEMDVIHSLKNPTPKKPMRRVRRLVKSAL